jgi:hypothetical protein
VLLGPGALQPAKKNLGGARIGHCASSQALLDLGIRGRLTLSARCAALATQPCRFSGLLGCPSVRSCSDSFSFRVRACFSFSQLGRGSPPFDS